MSRPSPCRSTWQQARAACGVAATTSAIAAASTGSSTSTSKAGAVPGAANPTEMTGRLFNEAAASGGRRWASATTSSHKSRSVPMSRSTTGVVRRADASSTDNTW